MGKGEIARYKQFLLFPQCFQKACFPEASKVVIVWEWVNPFPNFRPFQTEPEIAGDNFKSDDNVGKGEIACYEQFLLFPHCFQKACFPGASKGVIVWEWLKTNCHFLKSQ